MAQADEYDHLYKIVLVGDATVGKTHLVSRYCRGTLPKAPQATIGVEFATRTVPLRVGGTVKAQIWDTAGQERYRSITSAHYRRAVGALLVYDVTRKQTYININKWLEDLRHNADPDVVVMLVGNKTDLVEEDPHKREVPFELAQKFAQSNGLFFSETSAVTNYNVKKVFEYLLQEIYNERAKQMVYSELPTDGSGGGIVPSGYGGGSPFVRIDEPSKYLQGGIKLDASNMQNNSAQQNKGCCGNG